MYFFLIKKNTWEHYLGFFAKEEYLKKKKKGKVTINFIFKK